MLTEEIIHNALKTVKYPGFSRAITSFGLVKAVAINGDEVRITLQINTNKPGVAEQIQADCEKAIGVLSGVRTVRVDMNASGISPQKGEPGHDPWSHQNRIPGVQRVIAVASGKGGVGKSTVAVNLACALNHLGAKVGLLDCDIYGPSIPLMMGIRQRPTISAAEKLVPPVNYGIKLMSIGFLVDDDAPVIWRGPMITKTIHQFLNFVEWGELDYLLVDLPPGTGDAQLSLCQTVPLDGGLVVTTPQEASLGVVRKGIAMFEKVNVPILGLIENMSFFVTPNGERVEIFGHGGGRQEAARQSLPFLGEIPIFTEIRIGGDSGVPVVAGAPDTVPAEAFFSIARLLQKRF